jgi:hypothetical protein
MFISMMDRVKEWKAEQIEVVVVAYLPAVRMRPKMDYRF